MSIAIDIAYNIQNHGTDFNLATSGDNLSNSNSRIYTWQAANCESDDSVFLADTLARKCLWASGTSVAVHDCVGSDRQWSVLAVDGSPDAYNIQSDNGDGETYLSTNDDKSFALIASRVSSYAQWSFQAPSSDGNVTWNVCDHIGAAAVSSSITAASSTIALATSTDSLTMTTSPASNSSGVMTLAASQASSAAVRTSLLVDGPMSAEVLAAATAGSSNSISSQLSTQTVPSASAATSSGVGISQANASGSANVGMCTVLIALMIGVAAVST